MADIKEIKLEKETKAFTGMVGTLVLIMFGAVVGLVIAYLFFPPLTIGIREQYLALVGDYVGGILNPVFGFITVLLLIYTTGLTREELKLARKEMQISNLQAAKSAEAVSKQAEFQIKTAGMTEAEMAIAIYQENLDKLMNKKWVIDKEIVRSLGVNNLAKERYLNLLDNSYELFTEIITFERLASDRAKLGSDSISLCLKYFEQLEYTKGFAPFIAFREQALKSLQKKSESIARLIRFGLSHDLCEIKVQGLFVEVNDTRELKLISESNSNEIFQIIKIAALERNDATGDFPQFHNKYRES